MHFFSGGSGFPFGGFSSRDDDDDDDLPNNEKYYNILNLKKECSQTEVKKAYTDLAKKHHPDKQGGNAEKVYFLSFSSNKLLRHTKYSMIQKREEFMINMAKKDSKTMVSLI